MFRKRSSRLSIIVAVLGLLAGTLTVAAAPAQHSASDVYRVSDLSLVDGAQATLLRNDYGIRMTLHTVELEPGAAYTVWWIIFNNPDACTHGVPGITQCGEGDLSIFGGDPAAMSSVLNAVGHVIGENGTGNFAAHLSVGGPTGQVLFGDGLLEPRGAEIMLIVRTHGQPIPGLVHEQISTFEGGCDVNVCEDVQLAAFPAS